MSTRCAGLRTAIAIAASLSCALTACGPRAYSSTDSIAELREHGQASRDDLTVARWLLGESLSRGGSAKRAAEARKRLDQLRASHYLSHLARGLDDRWHGRIDSAPGHFLAALASTADEDSPEARLVGWYAASQTAALGPYVAGFWERARPVIEGLIEQPRGIGWRARALLVQWWLEQVTRRESVALDHSVERLGCVTELRLAGPFGSDAPVHLHRPFPAEAPGPWPQRWPVDASSGLTPRVLDRAQRGCEVVVEERVAAGVFYAEAFVELAAPAEVILAAQGALALWVDDRLALDRDPRVFGIWPKFGVAVRLSAGRHRVLARLSEPHTLLRAMKLDGTPLDLLPNGDAAEPYVLEAPQLLGDPNDLMRFVGPEGNLGEPDDVTRFVAGELAHLEGEDDVSTILLAPLSEPNSGATGPVLATLAEWVDGDPLFGRSEATDRARALCEAAVAKDPELWRAHLGVALAKANTGGVAGALAEVAKLTERFPRVPALYNALAVVYGRLGWQPEQRRVVLELAQRFGEPVLLRGALDIQEERGHDAEARALIERIVSLDRNSDVVLERALRRRDYRAALAEIEGALARQPHRRVELERRRTEIRLQAGDSSALRGLLEGAVLGDPESGVARLGLGDLRLAEGEPGALTATLAEATQAGADIQPLARAIDAVEARSDFAPLRLDGREVIAAYEAAGRHQSATAARVLDYAAVWVHSDGSSRMLEHEIVRIQSAEAISKFAEHRKLGGLVLNMRVIKKDGRTLEPEQVEGKPTVTFPHLEEGDYIETEYVQGFPATEEGRYYAGMRWFFREENVAYARSEFVLIAPVHRRVQLEITGDVPEPEMTTNGLFVTRRWRVDDSPAAAVEPLSVPVQEFLPSVRVGWGNDMARRLRLLSEQVADTLPVDPRIRELANGIAGPDAAPLDRARKAYRWVQANIKQGQESDGRKALTGKQGNRWSALRTLLRALDVPAEYLVVKNRLAPASLGPMSEAEAFSVPLLRVGQGEAAAWLTLQEQYAPFGYVPVEARGMPGHALSIDGQRPVVVPASGDQDRLEYEGSVELAASGSARVSLRQRFVGKYAIRLRAGLEQVPEGRMHEILQTRLLAQALPGAELLGFGITGREELDEPLVVEMQASVENFAEVHPDGLLLVPPLMPELTRLASLPERQTPLLIREAMHQRSRLEIRLAPGARVSGLSRGHVSDAGHDVVAKDTESGGVLVLEREVSIPAGRVALADYARFRTFTEQGERLLSQSILISNAPGGEGAPP